MADVQGSALCHGSTPGALFKMSELKVGDVANEQNLKPVRTKSEARERGRKGGKASGAARRRKADFRRTLNMLLTAEIDNEEWKPVLESLGVECTLESAMLMAQIKEAVKGIPRLLILLPSTPGRTVRPRLTMKSSVYGQIGRNVREIRKWVTLKATMIIFKVS